MKQDGVESNIVFKNNNQKLSIYNTISSSKQTDGSHQLNRPDSTYGVSYDVDINNSFFGPFSINYNYKHYGKSFDFAPTVTKVDSTDIMNLSFSKNINIGVLSFNISNLLDEAYQRPHGYTQNGRQINIAFRMAY